MRLDHLSICNFKALREVDVDFEPATVIVGANDSGKSSLLDAIHWIFSTADRSGRPYSAARYLRGDYLGTCASRTVGKSREVGATIRAIGSKIPGTEGGERPR